MAQHGCRNPRTGHGGLANGKFIDRSQSLIFCAMFHETTGYALFVGPEMQHGNNTIYGNVESYEFPDFTMNKNHVSCWWPSQSIPGIRVIQLNWRLIIEPKWMVHAPKPQMGTVLGK